MNKSDKSKSLTLILCIFLGVFGVHRFYVGKVKSGILYLCTLGVFGVGWIYDIFNIVNNLFTDSNDEIVSNKITDQISINKTPNKPAYMMWQFWTVIVVFYIVVFFASSKPVKNAKDIENMQPDTTISTEISHDTDNSSVTNIESDTETVIEADIHTSTKEKTTSDTHSSSQTSNISESKESKSESKTESKVESKVESAVPKPQLQEYVFYANMSTKCYHTTNCHAAQEISDENRFTYTVTANSLYDAKQIAIQYFESQGYTLCGICGR